MKDYADKSFGFQETVKLKIKRGHYRYTGNIDYVKLGKPIFNSLCKRWGSYSIQWYFTTEDNIKYFDGEEWHRTSLNEVLNHIA